MYDIYGYFDFNIGYLIVATEIVDSRYLTLVLALAYGSFSLSDAVGYLGGCVVGSSAQH